MDGFFPRLARRRCAQAGFWSLLVAAVVLAGLAISALSSNSGEHELIGYFAAAMLILACARWLLQLGMLISLFSIQIVGGEVIVTDVVLGKKKVCRAPLAAISGVTVPSKREIRLDVAGSDPVTIRIPSALFSAADVAETRRMIEAKAVAG